MHEDKLSQPKDWDREMVKYSCDVCLSPSGAVQAAQHVLPELNPGAIEFYES